MNAVTETKPAPKTGLDLLREPFPAHQISKLPKPTTKQTNDLRAAMERKDFSLGIRCELCGQWHHKDTIHLDYVGHAALTDRLLDCDPEWNWEPMALTPAGLPAMDNNGMWIKLTVCGVTRYGFGNADGKTGGDAIKEIIGDALRNAAMRFGAALDLWHKGDLHGPAEHDTPPARQEAPAPRQKAERKADPFDPIEMAIGSLRNADTLEALAAIWTGEHFPRGNPKVEAAKDARKAALKATAPAITDDEIPY